MLINGQTGGGEVASGFRSGEGQAVENKNAVRGLFLAELQANLVM